MKWNRNSRGLRPAAASPQPKVDYRLDFEVLKITDYLFATVEWRFYIDDELTDEGIMEHNMRYELEGSDGWTLHRSLQHKKDEYVAYYDENRRALLNFPYKAGHVYSL